jgi:methyl-accepting chemotaxis protein/methyl-accepting chemotaxis protein-1 (serine sensor receptor)
MLISRMTVGKKFALTGALLMALCAVSGGVALVGLGGLQDLVTQLAMDALPGLSECSIIESALNEMRGDMLKHITAVDADTKRAADDNIQKLKQKIHERLAAYEKSYVDDRDRQLFAAVTPAFEHYFTVCDGVLAVSRGGDNATAYKKYDNESIKAGIYKAARNAIQALSEHNRKSGARCSADAAAAGARARWLIWSLLVACFSTGSVLLYVIVHGINRALQVSVSELSEGAAQVARAASQVAVASQSLAQGSAEQAASLEETSASTEEINSLVRRNTENSGNSADLFAKSHQRFQETNHSLDEMTVAMSEISHSSDRIAKIIKVIDEIAFQTNLLALNAAVEAARAGEAGMGFAVVADEVRNLAQRCTQAARDTADLIEDSIARSNRGKAKVDQVANSIRTITDDAAKIKILVDEVNVGSQEQARGISQIGTALAQMEEVTQKTAANAEESAAAAQELNAQSEALKAVVERLSALVSSRS